MTFDCFELNIIRRFAGHFHDDYIFTGETFIDTYESFNVLTDDTQKCALREALRKLVLSCHDNEEFVSRIAELGGPGLGSSKNSFELAKQAIASGVPGTSLN